METAIEHVAHKREPCSTFTSLAMHSHDIVFVCLETKSIKPNINKYIFLFSRHARTTTNNSLITEYNWNLLGDDDAWPCIVISIVEMTMHGSVARQQQLKCWTIVISEAVQGHGPVV